MPWHDTFVSSFTTGFERWTAEERQLPELNKLDEKLKLRKNLFQVIDANGRPVTDPNGTSKPDLEAANAYNGLNEVFGDEKLDSLSRGHYDFDPDSMTAFHGLLADAKGGAQRNATELGTELATAIALARDEVKNANRDDDTIWQKSEIYKRLEELKAALRDWDKLLAVDALPDRDGLKDSAKKCNDKFEACYREHFLLTRTGAGKEAVPYTKYQLLATMRALAEKVASQFAARAGRPSFSAMYELICDVPNRGPFKKGTEAADALVKFYGTDLGKAWTAELKNMERALIKEDKVAAKDLKEEFKKLTEKEPPVDLEGALDEWRAHFKDPELLKKEDDQKVLRAKIAEIAFGLRKYKEAVDSVLEKVDQTKVGSVRKTYQEIFDGFARQMHKEILFCKDNL